jgi:hypothetical protein
LGLGIPLFARLWSGRAQFDGISGDFVRFAPVLRTGLPILSAQALPLCGFNCAGAFLRGFGLNRRRQAAI